MENVCGEIDFVMPTFNNGYGLWSNIILEALAERKNSNLEMVELYLAKKSL